MDSPADKGFKERTRYGSADVLLRRFVKVHHTYVDASTIRIVLSRTERKGREAGSNDESMDKMDMFAPIPGETIGTGLAVVSRLVTGIVLKFSPRKRRPMTAT